MTDLSSQLNPSGCGKEISHSIDNVVTICGRGNNYFRLTKNKISLAYKFELCPICSAKRLATAKALYSEKKKTLNELSKELEMLPWCCGYTAVVNEGKLVDLNSKIEKMNKWYSEKLISLMREIKQIETECSEVLNA